jgi:hypothetical protein
MVVIICPKTGQEVPTGIVTDIQTFVGLPKGQARLDCSVCGDVHPWCASDAMLAQSSGTLVAERSFGKGDE